MPKNKGKGGKNRRRGKNENEETKRQLEFKEPGQEYSQVVRMLGNGRCECYCRVLTCDFRCDARDGARLSPASED